MSISRSWTEIETAGLGERHDGWRGCWSQGPFLRCVKSALVVRLGLQEIEDHTPIQRDTLGATS
jgi:hypothetical protein